MSSTDDRDVPEAERHATPTADAVDQVAILTAERDAALTASYRQRERLQAEIDRAQQAKREKDSELRRTRRQLDKARRRFAFRAQRRIERVLSPVRALTGRGSSAAPVGVDGVPPDQAPAARADDLDLAARFREVMTARLTGSSEIANGPVRVAVVGPTRGAGSTDDAPGR